MKLSAKRLMWIELSVWLLIVCITIVGVRIHKMNKLKELVTYQIFMPDVDGVIKGSPVKFMGVQVGYVDKVKILTDTVYLKIVITEKDIVLPKGSIATVEFNGMGGSKSLEIYPPTKESIASGNLINVQSPKRLHDSLGLLNDMFDKIDSIMNRMSVFSKETGVTDISKGIKIEGIEGNVGLVNDFIKEIGEYHEKRKNNK